ncbi:hypothetical protein AMATHDRAFT_11188 [Amanita thiersii Skay4041]|uniref:Uncharacterized protein n=1 Tax=Amanita thiersii Skay4041 TaxID=703135 RepID=A0A2A9NAE2_9AGAR|nr:hypothetical protein AMATHDRAFT_11188 [Amanita thiersii Skay4041]
MHALNGNMSHIHEQILFVREYNNTILYIMEHLKDAPQITIDSFFESPENHFIIWTLSKTLLERYGVHISDEERDFFNNTLSGIAQIEEEQEQTIFADPQILQCFMFIFQHINEATAILEACRILPYNDRICYLSLAQRRMFIWVIGGERALNHFGLHLSAEERNRFMHALNGNGNDIKTSEMDRIPIMDGMNYTLWAYPMRAYLEFKGYWLITTDGLPDIAT